MKIQYLSHVNITQGFAYVPKLVAYTLEDLLHDSDRVYIEKMQVTIPSLEIRKKIEIREKFFCMSYHIMEGGTDVFGKEIFRILIV